MSEKGFAPSEAINGGNGNGVAEQINRKINLLVGATVIVVLILGAVILWFAITSSKANDALCALRADIEQRIERSEALLKSNPDLAERLGLSPELVQRQMDDQRRSVAALEPLDC